MKTALDYAALREHMVRRQIAARGVCSEAVLEAMGKVRREGYVPSYLGEFAYQDAPLPIEEEQTISQPYIVAFMVEALQLRKDDRVLEIGTGSGYAAAVLAEIANQVYTIERHERLARTAAERLKCDGYTHVQVRQGDGTLGWPEAAPFDAIVVAAGGPEVPPSLREQLAIGGRLVIPVGTTVGLQKLVRVTRESQTEFQEEVLAEVRFVPLIGSEGWGGREPQAPVAVVSPPALPEWIAEGAEHFNTPEQADLSPLLNRIADARIVLLGEATHGTKEFYEMRARITQELIEGKNFNIVAVEADWPDAARIDHYVRDREALPSDWQAFARFPTWMWRNREVQAFVEWLRQHNSPLAPEKRVRFSGLDLYGLYNSISVVLQYLEEVDPETARVAKERYGCLTPWQSDPAAYGRATLTDRYRTCEPEVVCMLEDLLEKQIELTHRQDGEHFFDVVQNARLIADAELYYRVMYYGAHQSWNLRDRHMFEVLGSLLEFWPGSKAVVWAHNSHVGNALATEMSARGELNLGQLCRQQFGQGAYLVGFGTDRGTVAAASHWEGPMEIKDVRPSQKKSYERLCHESGLSSFLLPLGLSQRKELLDRLGEPRLERAIGVIYRPETEMASHYFHAVLPQQFNEYIWFDKTSAVQALRTREIEGMPETYPFGL